MKATGFVDLTDKILKALQEIKTPKELEKLRNSLTDKEVNGILHRVASDKVFEEAYLKEIKRLWKWVR